MYPDTDLLIDGAWSKGAGERAIIIDSITEADRPDWKGSLDVFPYYFHEPYFADWVGSDPAALFIAHGLRSVDSEIAFLSRVMVFERD